MPRKSFFSRLFKKQINTDDSEYEKLVYAEALYKYFEITNKHCDCWECKQKKEKLHKYLKDNFYK